MKKYLKVFISMFITVSFIVTGCAKDNSMGGDPPGSASAHMCIVRGRVTEIVGKNLVLINVLRGIFSDFQKGDIVAIKYDVSQDSGLGLDNLEGFEAKPMEVQVGDIVSVMYSKAEKRDIGEIKDSNYITTSYLSIVPKERYKSIYPDEVDES